MKEGKEEKRMRHENKKKEIEKEKWGSKRKDKCKKKVSSNKGRWKEIEAEVKEKKKKDILENGKKKENVKEWKPKTVWKITWITESEKKREKARLVKKKRNRRI